MHTTKPSPWRGVWSERPSIAESVLILAQSARALASAAWAAGFEPHVLDLFGDEDTLACAASWQRLELDARGALDCANMVATVQCLLRHVPSMPVVWGGGLETYPEALRALAAGGSLLGSNTVGLAQLQDPLALAASLRVHGIVMPPMSLHPSGETGWLSKRVGGAGGMHVQAADGCTPTESGRYFQRHIDGEACSVTLLAMTDGVRILGWNRLLRDECLAGPGFAWQGAITAPDLPRAVRESIGRAAGVIADELGWRGLCGLDFIMPTDGGEPLVIDLNPRPTATFVLHTPAAHAFRLHLDACRGLSPVLEPMAGRQARQGLRVVYAAHPLAIPNSLDWPPWISDRPARGSRLGAGDPVCTVHASGSCHAEVLASLQSRALELMDSLCHPR